MENNKINSNSGLGLGIAGLVLGIFGLLLAFFACTSVAGLVLAILGVALSSVGYTQARKVSAPSSLIMAALVVSIIAASFALIRISNSMMKLRNFPWEKIGAKIEHNTDKDSSEFERVFTEEFEKEFQGDMEDVLRKLEGDTGRLDKKIDSIEINLDNLSDEEKAYRLGKATGKALRIFIDEISDSTSDK